LRFVHESKIIASECEEKDTFAPHDASATRDADVLRNGRDEMDRRTAYTRMVLKEALLEMLEDRHLEDVTVKELCARADVNRTTFYRNFGDVYDLFEQTERELTKEAFSSGDMESDRFALLDVIYGNQAFYREFFRAHLKSPLVEETVRTFGEEMRDELKARGSYDERTFDVFYRYNVHGVVGVIEDWLEGGCRETPQQLGELLYSVVDKQYR
jgi:AcrR family transcriptional regulator